MQHELSLVNLWNNDYCNYCGAWLLKGGKQAN